MRLVAKHIATITLLLATLSPTAACAQQGEASLQEASANFDLSDVEPFLARVVQLVDSGFGPTEAKTLSAKIAGQAVDSEYEYAYSVLTEGIPTQLRIVVFMDDVESPDIAFFSDAKLAKRLNTAIQQYFRNAGQ